MVLQTSWACPVAQRLKEFTCSAGDTEVRSILGSGRSLEDEMGTHSSILAWRIPQRNLEGYSKWGHTELGGYDWRDWAYTHTQTSKGHRFLPASCWTHRPGCGVLSVMRPIPSQRQPGLQMAVQIELGTSEAGEGPWAEGLSQLPVPPMTVSEASLH